MYILTGGTGFNTLLPAVSNELNLKVANRSPFPKLSQIAAIMISLVRNNETVPIAEKSIPKKIGSENCFMNF